MKRACETYGLWISEALNGTLPASQRRELEQHLKSCVECRAFRLEMARLVDALHRLPPPRAPVDLGRRIVDRVWQPPPEPTAGMAWWSAWRHRLAIVGAVAAALAVGYGLGVRTPSDESSSPAALFARQGSARVVTTLEPGYGLLEDFMQDYVPEEVVNPLSEEPMSLAGLGWEAGVHPR